jgi:hypothetical protein
MLLAGIIALAGCKKPYKRISDWNFSSFFTIG